MNTRATPIERFRLSKDALADVPPQEVELFLALGHLHNELTLLQKLVIWSFCGEDAAEPHLQAQITQSMILLRYLGATIFEGWQTLQKEFFGRRISKSYEADLTGIARQAYESVKSYNKASNPLKTLRNDFVFHSSGSGIGRGLQHMSDETLDMYLGRSGTNSLFYASEVVLNLSLLGAVDAAARKEKLSELVDAIVDQAGNWLLLIEGIIDVFLRRYPAVQEREVEKFELELGCFDAISIPWFIGPPQNILMLSQDPAR